LSFYERHILPHVINFACSAKPIRYQRGKVVPAACGRVLELGIGSGLNLPFYDPAAVEVVIGVDPSAGLRHKALTAPRADGLTVELREGEAESLPFDAGEFDTVVCTFTLCSVRDPAAALAEARRVLKLGGALLFSEHGLAPDPSVERWQRRIEPTWKRIAGGCHLTRPVAKAIAAAGFSITDFDSMYLPGTPRPFGWSEWGRAQRV
jgi:ubiquinone/menaquinone biosynthesis C-methylase UbiE